MAIYRPAVVRQVSIRFALREDVAKPGSRNDGMEWRGNLGIRMLKTQVPMLMASGLSGIF